MQNWFRLAAVGAAALLIGTGGAQAQAPTTLTLTTINAPGHWSETEGHEPFMACVKQATNSGIDFKYFHTSQIATAATSLDALNKGVAHISFVVPTSINDKMPLTNVALLPDMGDSVTQMVRAFRKVSEGNGPIAKEFAAVGIKPLIFNMFPPNQIMSRRDGLKTAESFRGKKVRIAGGAHGFAMTSLGAAPTQIGFGEIYLALQQGTIDAYLFTVMTVKNFSLQEVTKAISRNANFGTALGLIAMDLKTFEGLPANQQKVLVDCGLKQEAHLAKYAEETVGKLNDEFQKLGIDIYDLNDKEKAAIGEKLKLSQKDYIDRLARRGMPAQEAYDEYVKALK